MVSLLFAQATVVPNLTDQFSLSNYGIFGVIISVLLVAVRYLYKRTEILSETLRTQEKSFRDELQNAHQRYQERFDAMQTLDNSRDEKVQTLAIRLGDVIVENTTYLKMLHQAYAGQFKGGGGT